MKSKICTKCNIKKELSEFYFRKDTNRYRNECKECHILQKKEYFLLNKDIRLKQQKYHYKENKEEILKRNKKWFEKNKEKRAEYCKKYNQNNKNRNNQRSRERYEFSVNYKLRMNLKNRLTFALNGKSKIESILELLGCSIEQLKKYLESQFEPKMSWDNHTMYGWHIDHIKPCASFDLSKKEQRIRCFNYKNLQPLWAEENWKKSNK